MYIIYPSHIPPTCCGVRWMVSLSLLTELKGRHIEGDTAAFNEEARRNDRSGGSEEGHEAGRHVVRLPVGTVGQLCEGSPVPCSTTKL